MSVIHVSEDDVQTRCRARAFPHCRSAAISSAEPWRSRATSGQGQKWARVNGGTWMCARTRTPRSCADRKRNISRVSCETFMTPARSPCACCQAPFRPRLPGGGERVEIHTSAQARLCPSRQCLQHMRAAPDSAVKDHIDLVAHRVFDLRDLIERLRTENPEAYPQARHCPCPA